MAAAMPNNVGSIFRANMEGGQSYHSKQVVFWPLYTLPLLCICTHRYRCVCIWNKKPFKTKFLTKENKFSSVEKWSTKEWLRKAVCKMKEREPHRRQGTELKIRPLYSLKCVVACVWLQWCQEKQQKGTLSSYQEPTQFTMSFFSQRTDLMEGFLMGFVPTSVNSYLSPLDLALASFLNKTFKHI